MPGSAWLTSHMMKLVVRVDEPERWRAIGLGLRCAVPRRRVVDDGLANFHDRIRGRTGSRGGCSDVDAVASIYGLSVVRHEHVRSVVIRCDGDAPVGIA